MTPAERMARGHRALSDFREVEGAFDRVEAAITSTIVGTAVGENEKILALHAQLRGLLAVRKAIQAVVEDGELARAMQDI